MAITSLWSVCQFDLMNSLLSMTGLSILVFGYALFTAVEINDNENETKK